MIHLTAIEVVSKSFTTMVNIKNRQERRSRNVWLIMNTLMFLRRLWRAHKSANSTKPLASVPTDPIMTTFYPLYEVYPGNLIGCSSNTTDPIANVKLSNSCVFIWWCLVMKRFFTFTALPFSVVITFVELTQDDVVALGADLFIAILSSSEIIYYFVNRISKNNLFGVTVNFCR